MTTYYLINQIRVGTLTSAWPGSTHDSRYDPVDKLRSVGGWLVPAPNAVLEVAAKHAMSVREHSGPIEEAAGIMLAAYASTMGGVGPTPADVMEANCLATDEVGDLVYVRGDSVAGLPQVERADVTTWDKMPAIGLILSKAAPTDAMVIRRGLVDIVGLNPGKLVFVGVDGKPTTTRPSPTGTDRYFVQVVGSALDTSRLMLCPELNVTRIRS